MARSAVGRQSLRHIGSGSGWTTALLGHIVGPTGKVFAVEIIPELVTMGRENCKKVGASNVGFFQATNKIGLSEYAPYDRILVSAAATTMPDELYVQLVVGGKLVIPIRYDIYELTKTNHGWNRRIHPGFAFVPLV